MDSVSAKIIRTVYLYRAPVLLSILTLISIKILATYDIDIPPFKPVQVIFSHAFLPWLFSPVSQPQSTIDWSVRIGQLIWLAFEYPGCNFYELILSHYGISLTRIIIGAIFTRGFGFSLTWLYSSSSGYEVMAGVGPAVALITILHDSKTPIYIKGLVFTLSLCLERAPWSYLCALLLVVLCICCRFADICWTRSWQPENILELPANPPRNMRFELAFIKKMPLFFIILASYASITKFLESQSAPHLSTSYKATVVIISASRPRSTLNETVASYLPLISSNVNIVVYTNQDNMDHNFHNLAPSYKEFGVQFVAQKIQNFGSQLHSDLSSLFSWLTENSKSDWMMLIEDDFPMCAGSQGLLGIHRAFAYLADSSSDSTSNWSRAGFVGFGGSGLIFHRSLWPIIAYTLLQPPIDGWRESADIILQSCALSVKGSGCGREGTELVITSRLTMRHTGGAGNSALRHWTKFENWQCGWRHPLHGHMNVKVLDNK